MISNCNPK